MTGFSELDLLAQFHRTWDKLLTTAFVTLFTYVIFCSAMVALRDAFVGFLPDYA